MLRDVSHRNTPPPEIRVGEQFTFAFFCLQSKHPACVCFLTKFFYREGLLAPRPTPNLEDHPSSDVRDCLFNLFEAPLLIAGRSSIRNLRTRHALVTGREGDHWEDLGVDGWIILGWISSRWDVGIWTGLGWPRIETGGGRL